MASNRISSCYYILTYRKSCTSVSSWFSQYCCKCYNIIFSHLQQGCYHEKSSAGIGSNVIFLSILSGYYRKVFSFYSTRTAPMRGATHNPSKRNASLTAPFFKLENSYKCWHRRSGLRKGCESFKTVVIFGGRKVCHLLGVKCFSLFSFNTVRRWHAVF